MEKWRETEAKNRSSRAGLQFPVDRIHRLLRKGNYAERVGAAEHRSIWPQSCSVWWWWPRFLSLLATLLVSVTTRRLASFHVTFSWSSAMTRTWTSCYQSSRSLRVVFCLTSRLFCYPRRRRRRPSRRSADNFHLTTTGSFQNHPHLRRGKRFLRFGSYHISIIFHVNSSPTILHISMTWLIYCINVWRLS